MIVTLVFVIYALDILAKGSNIPSMQIYAYDKI